MLSRSRDPSESLSLGGAPFLHRSPEETNVCQRGKAVKLCLSDVRNPVWRTSDYGAAIWPLFAARFARDLRHYLEKRTTTSPRPNHRTSDSDSPSISRSLLSRSTSAGVSRQVRKSFSRPGVSYSRATLYHWLLQTVGTVKRARVARMTNSHITR